MLHSVAESLTNTKSIHEFVAEFICKYTCSSIFDAELLAKEFRNFFVYDIGSGVCGFDHFVNEHISEIVCIPQKLPKNSRGIHSILKRDILIGYEDDEWEGAQEFTIAHEIREIIGEIAERIDKTFIECKGEALERQADNFAAALLLQYKKFFQVMLDCGLDPICLRQEFNKAYVTVVARMATVIRLNSKSKIQLWAGVYERDFNESDCIFKSACFHRSTPYKPYVRYRVPNFLFPRRGQIVELNGNLLKAYGMGRSVFVEKVTGLDFGINSVCH